MADDELGISEDDVDELSELFHLASNFVRSSTNSFNQEQLLYLYARFKQVGNQVNSKIHIYNNVSLDHMLWYNIVLYIVSHCIQLYRPIVYMVNMRIQFIVHLADHISTIQLDLVTNEDYNIVFLYGILQIWYVLHVCIYIHNFHGNKLRL